MGNMKFDVHESSKFLLSFLNLREETLKYILYKKSKLDKPFMAHIYTVSDHRALPHTMESSDYRYAPIKVP